MCWLCGTENNVEKCLGCIYTSQISEPVTKLPTWFHERFNSRCFVPSTTYLTKIWFTEKKCFSASTKIIKRVEKPKPKMRVGMTIGRDLWDRSKRRAIANVSLELMRDLGRQYEVPAPIVRVIRFRKLLDILATKPSAPVKFLENEQILRKLTASHLRLIVGRAEWTKYKTQLYPLIDNEHDLSSVENVVWVTNRQQGKTTNLAKFNAALILLSPVGGNVKFVYSTGLDRAQELCRESKKYIQWIRGDDDVMDRCAALGMSVPRITTDNERMFITECTIAPGIFNTLKARPMNADGCRGDNPASADFDEVGFIDQRFWFLFAFPLLQVGGRVFTMATTPPPINSFFDDFSRKIRKRNENNDFLFLFINHSMTCADCIERDVAAKCSHKLYLVPKWKNISKFVSMRVLVPGKQRKAFEAEIYGVMEQEAPTYFPKTLTDYVFIGKPRVNEPPDFGQQPVVYISVDPASHSVSCMGITAAVYTTTGQLCILGMAEVSIARCQTIQITMMVQRFTESVMHHVFLRRYLKSNVRVIPIVECVNNEPAARDIVVCIRETATSSGFGYVMPFKKRYFTTAIQDDLGVWTTNQTKASAITMTYHFMFENRLIIADPLVTVGEIYKKGATNPTAKEICELYRDELVQFHDEGKHKTITGKTASTNDDGAMSLIQLVGWSKQIRAVVTLEDMALVTI